MLKIITIFLFLAIYLNAVSNIRFIDVSKIPLEESNKKDLLWVSENLDKFESWSPQWEYTEPKKQISAKLRKIYSNFSKLAKKNRQNQEMHLLMGNLAHFMYNLDIPKSFGKGISHYLKAIALDSNDYRCYWFLGFHYCEAGNGNIGMPYLQKVLDLVPYDDLPLEFYHELAFSSYVSVMLSHSIFAFDRIKEITGDSSELEKSLNKIISKNRIVPHPDSTYAQSDIWNARQSNMVELSSLLLGTRFSVKPDWKLQLFAFGNRTGGLTLTPDAENGYNESKVTYSIALFFKVPKENESLSDAAGNLLPGVGIKREISFSGIYPGMITWEILDSNLYPEQGGAHMLLLAFERPYPRYPGLQTELPAVLPKGDNSASMSFYKAKPVFTRFEGTLYYFVLLDTCNAIFEKSTSVFRKFFENNLIVE